MSETAPDFAVSDGGRITIQSPGTYVVDIDGKTITVVVADTRHDPGFEEALAGALSSGGGTRHDTGADIIVVRPHPPGGHDSGPERIEFDVQAPTGSDPGFHDPGDEATEL